MRRIINIICAISVTFAVCPEGFYEDDCGNCWLPYCYDSTTNLLSYDTSLEACLDNAGTWVFPGEESDLFFNNYCESCPEGFSSDNCGHCWSSYCYTYFSTPQHTVYWDLSENECEELGYYYYYPGDDGDPYFNINCEDCLGAQIFDECDICRDGEDDPYWNVTCADCADEPNGYALIDECGDCQLAYCYDYVIQEFNYDYPCNGTSEILIMPDNPSNELWNSGCDTDCISGDVNGDTFIDVLDIVAIVEYILNPSSGNQIDCADYIEDENIDVLDVVAMVNEIIR